MTYTTTAKLDDGTEVECEFEVIEHGSPGNGWDDPGEGSIVGVDEVTLADGTLLLVDDAQRERLEAQIAEQIDSDPHYFDIDD